MYQLFGKVSSSRFVDAPPVFNAKAEGGRGDGGEKGMKVGATESGTRVA